MPIRYERHRSETEPNPFGGPSARRRRLGRQTSRLRCVLTDGRRAAAAPVPRPPASGAYRRTGDALRPEPGICCGEARCCRSLGAPSSARRAPGGAWIRAGRRTMITLEERCGPGAPVTAGHSAAQSGQSGRAAGARADSGARAREASGKIGTYGRHVVKRAHKLGTPTGMLVMERRSSAEASLTKECSLYLLTHCEVDPA